MLDKGVARLREQQRERQVRARVEETWESRGWHNIGNKTENVEQEPEQKNQNKKESRGW